MCGIVGYIGHEKIATKFVLDGLQALEYRGYDSAGLATISRSKAKVIKQTGRVDGLRRQVGETLKTDTEVAVGHTRWATHGAPTSMNAHPHTNSSQTIFVVHNGIIENYQQLKTKLKKAGYTFASETDTEVIPHLIDHYLKTSKTFIKAFEKAVKDLQGAYAIAALYSLDPDELYVARLSSPLVIGVSDNGHFLASDASALIQQTKKVIYLDDYEVAAISPDAVKIHNIRHSVQVLREAEELDYDHEKSALGNFPHYMLKEIYEAPGTIRLSSLGRINAGTHTVKLGGLEIVQEQMRHIDRIVIVACGTASYAGMLGEYLIEELAGIPVEVQTGSEFKYRSEPFSRGTALIAISQSGETADTIAALKKAEKYGVLRLGVVNAVGSTVARMTDAGVYCHAGIEQAVASTKAFIAQVIVLLEIALFLARERPAVYGALLEEIEALPAKAEAVLKQSEEIKKIAEKYKNSRDFLYIGRRYAYPTALEGALKLKECALIHAEGFAAGEMKHGPLALIDKNFPTFALAGDGPMLEKTLSNIQEIKTRGGKVIAVATRGNKLVGRHADDIIYIPKTLEQTEPILQAIVMQLFAYYIAVSKGLDVDRPRNLAKSVTVE